MNEKGLMHNYINGEWCTSVAAETLEVINPVRAQYSMARLPRP